eukprot:SAG11_NODE_1974_length_3976_cov_1.663915_2_plen_163_part_00
MIVPTTYRFSNTHRFHNARSYTCTQLVAAERAEARAPFADRRLRDLVGTGHADALKRGRDIEAERLVAEAGRALRRTVRGDSIVQGEEDGAYDKGNQTNQAPQDLVTKAALLQRCGPVCGIPPKKVGGSPTAFDEWTAYGFLDWRSRWRRRSSGTSIAAGHL